MIIFAKLSEIEILMSFHNNVAPAGQAYRAAFLYNAERDLIACAGNVHVS